MLNEIAVKGNDLKMSSREVAELTGKQHKHVMDDVRKMLNSLDLQSADFTADYTDAKNRTYQCFNLPKRETLILVSGYSIELRAKIIDRWQELEKKTALAALPNFNDPIASARAWADEVEAKQKAFAIIQEKDKLIIAVADLNIRAGDVSISDFSKNLAIQGLGRNNLFKWLKARGYLMDSTEPYQPYVERGYFVRKPYEEKVNGDVKYKTMLTPRGCAWLSKILHAEFELGVPA
jgi:phage regulator Rha-like protein